MLASGLTVGSGLFAAGAASAAGGTSDVTAKITQGSKEDEQEPISYLDPEKHIWIKGNAGPFFIKIGGADPALPVYCIDLLQPASWDATYHETDWNSSSLQDNPGAGPKILWILQHSFPAVGADALSAASGVKGLSKADAAAGTQVAIWSFSDPNVQVKQEDKEAKAFTEWLIAQANQNGKGEEPKPTLTLDPTSVGGKSGTTLGPITVAAGGGTAAVSVALDDKGTAAKVTLVDDKGDAVKNVKSGDKVYAKVPAGAPAGSASITASGTATSSVGRAFVGRIDGKPSQTLILAGHGTVPVSAKAAISWGLGAVPTADAVVDCAKGALVVTLGNKGDKDAAFKVAGKDYTVKPGGTQTVTLPVKEDEKYDFTVTGPEGFSKQFTGLLNCKTDSATQSPAPSTGTPTPAPTTPAPSASPTGPELASTGGGMGAGLTAAMAGVLVVAGGAAVYGLRRRGRHSRAS
ncbi:Cys-Gln thioester bond-forming surface protein [Kitasatospora sp. NA04385]|uniref:Cys-Gln thioester bond-forming surface protein n=1 Tax=Kitasatospora sp. NA04385 TaxID=2742135 RepID=UPI0015914E84|nr:Cys-Gln thioester bond-forming surface protein [Kitasatospora sp. NA04385]QKW21952.1 Cys-Gln thioester bond-forming surface protein [Kitasatospora sp. NA04385]